MTKKSDEVTKKPDPTRDSLATMVEAAFREARKEGLSISDAADIIAEHIRGKWVEGMEASELSQADHVNIQSIVGAATGKPFVQCRVGYEQWQWGTVTAREHATALLRVAEAAEHDAAMMQWLMLGDIGLDRAGAMRAIFDLRRFRGDVLREDWRPPEHDDLGESQATGEGDDA